MSDTNNENLDGIQLAAALAEQIYRRSDDSAGDLDDQGVKLSELGVASVDLGDAISGLVRLQTAPNQVQDTDAYYYSSRGFVGRVVETADTLYVVFRGTDSAEPFLTGVKDALFAGAFIDPTIRDGDQLSDFGDFSASFDLGATGTFDPSQLEDALALTRAAKAIAGLKSIVVVGQSMGGGLAGLVSFIEGYDGFGIAPAPYSKQMEIEATLKVLAEYGVTKAAVATWGSFSYSVGAVNNVVSMEEVFITGDHLGDVLRLHNVNITDDQVWVALTAKQNLISSWASNFETHTITGEFLSEGLVADLGELADSVQFPVSATNTHHYDLGVTNPSMDERVALHSPALHNLVIRTDTVPGKQFAGLLHDDASLRYALLANQNISGPDAGDRADPDAGIYGGSGVNSSHDGASTQILYRALWRTVGETGGFYDKFYYNFGNRLSDGAVSQQGFAGYEMSPIHAGFMYLGLQVVRDAIIRDGTGIVGSKGLTVFDLAGLEGGVGIDMVDITGGTAFGKQELADAFASLVTQFLLSGTMNGSFNPYPGTGWSVAVAQAETSQLLYGMGTDGRLTGSVVDKSSIIFGGAGDDRIHGSSQKDYLWGGDGDDIIEAGDGADVVIGGNHGPAGDTISYSSSDAGVTVRLGTYAEQSGGHAQGDILIGFENVIGSAHVDHLRGDDNVNRLRGGGDDDFFYVEGSGSAATGDTFDGGDGFDTIDLSAANDRGVIPGLEAKFIRYTVDLGQGHVQGGEDSDVWTNLVSVENVEGSAYADQIFGDVGQNHLSGGAGNDFITGGGGNDVIIGGGDWNPNDTEVDTVCFSGVWSDYTITMSYGLDNILSYISVADRIANRDGVDAVYSCEWFQFQGTLLRYDQVANKAPTDVSLAGGVWNLIEDGFGEQPTASVIATLSSSDLNNTYVTGSPIDAAVYTLSPESSAYYEISGDQIVKKSFSIDYEAWYTKIHSIYDAIISPAGVTFSSWLEDIADGVSSIRQADVIAALEWPYKLIVTATDSGGLSYTKSLIVSVGNLSGSFTGDEADNVMTGTSEEDVSYGLGGDDTFLGSFGADQMFGGIGSDTVSYALPGKFRVVVNLASGGTEGDAAGDTYNSIENVIGTRFNDVLIGDSFNNEFTGGGGTDQISGGDGIDTVIFSGSWSQYAISVPFPGALYQLVDKISGRDGTDKIDFSVERFRFADVTLSASELLNQKPVASLALNSNLMEDVAGTAPLSGLVGSVSVIDPNNLNSSATVIDAVSAAVAQVSLPYYTLIGGEIMKLSGFELDYESWYSNLYSAWLSSGGRPPQFAAWLNDIKTDGIAASTPSAMLSLIDPRYKVTLELTDSHGSYQSTFIVYVKDVEGNVIGDGNDNILVGTNEEDTIQGLGGNDTLEGMLGPDVLDGGAGSDTASYKHADAGVIVNLLTNVNTGGHAQGDRFISIENLEGSDFIDTLTGDDTNNVLSGLAGNDILNGGGGDDVIRPGAGRDSSNGGSGINTIDYTDALVTVTIDLTAGTVIEVNASGQSTTGETAVNFQNAYGSNQSNRGDTLYGTSGNNILKGFAGDDSFYGRGGSDVFDGGVGVDKVSWIQETAGYISVNLVTGHNEGVAADDILISIENIEGTNGNDIIVGDDADNSLYGMGGDDTLDGGAGSNALYGGAGNDTFIGGIGNNWIDGGSGFDIVKAGIGAESVHALDTVTVDYSLSTTSVSLILESWYNYLIGHGGYADGDFVISKNIILIGSQYDDHLQGKFSRPGNLSYYPEYGNDVIYGGGGNDLIETSNGNNIAYGEQGDDTIIGKNDVDTFSGGDGDDILDGGKGADSLFGGAGWDWIDPGSDTDVDLVDFGDDGGGLKFTASGSVGNGYGINVDLSTMSISENRLGSAPVAGYWSNDIITGAVTGVWGTVLNDIIFGSEADNRIISGGGADVIHSGAGNDYISMEGWSTAWGEDGDDWIEVANGQATMYGGNGNDIIYGGRDSDNLFGDAGNDILYAWNPHLAATNAENSGAINHLTGGTGIDTMYGGQGQDIFHSLDDGDIIYGYFRETLDFSSSDHGVVYNAVTGTTSRGTVATNIYTVIGSEFSDEFFGVWANPIYGGGGNDVFHGPGVFYGDAGDDIFYAPGAGNMYATGGAGNDVFVSSSITGSYTMDAGDDLYIANHNHGTDYINGFDAGLGSGDKIALSSSYLVKDGSVISVEQFIDETARYDGYYNYTDIALGDTTIRLTGGNFLSQLHSDDFIFV